MASDPQIVVTGASGLVAKYVIAEFLRRGHSVRGTLRSMEKAEEVRRTIGRLGGATTHGYRALNAVAATVPASAVPALRTDPARLPHANIFHPLRYTLGMDEPVLGTTLLAVPLLPFTDDAVFLFNLVRLLTFILSGLIEDPVDGLCG